MQFPTMFFIVTAPLAMSARWFSSFSCYCSGLLSLPFKLLESLVGNWKVSSWDLLEHVSPCSQGEWLAHKLHQD
jgi:hypothetical protein